MSDFIGFEPPIPKTGGGGGGTSYLASQWWHPASIAMVKTPTPQFSQPNTLGTVIQFTNSGVSMTGMKCWWPTVGGTGVTLTFVLYDADGNILTQTTASSVAGSIVTGTFSSPYTIPDNLLFQNLMFAFYSSTVVYYSVSGAYGTIPLFSGNSVTVVGNYYALTAATFPTNATPSVFGLEPILTS